MLHDPIDMRVITRLSSKSQGTIPILRVAPRSAKLRAMSESTKIDLARLKRSIIANTGPGKKYSRRGLSLEASDGKNPDLVRDLINRGQDRKPSIQTVLGLAKALGEDINDFIIGNDSYPLTKSVEVTVIGSVEAGAWRQQERWDGDRQYVVEGQSSPFGNGTRFGLEVAGYSMDRKFLPGTVLDCFAVPGTPDLTPIPGDVVIVQRTRGDLTETTCKILERLPDGSFQLLCDSTRPEFAEPIPIGKPDNGHFGDDEIRIIGIVNSAITPVLKR